MSSTECHMCGKEQPEHALFDLLENYKSREISKLCSECMDKTNKHLSNLRLVNHEWYTRMLKIWMRNKRRKFTKGGE